MDNDDVIDSAMDNLICCTTTAAAIQDSRNTAEKNKEEAVQEKEYE